MKGISVPCCEIVQAVARSQTVGVGESTKPGGSALEGFPCARKVGEG